MHTDIHTACWNGDIELVKQFIDVDTRLVNSPDTTEYGSQMRPLHYAAYQVLYVDYNTLSIRLSTAMLLSQETASHVLTLWLCYACVDKSLLISNFDACRVI
jgi:hypothetical protein